MNSNIESLMNFELFTATCIAVIVIVMWIIKCNTGDDHESSIPTHAAVTGLRRSSPSTTTGSQPPSPMNVVVNIYSERNPVETLGGGGESTAVRRPAEVGDCPICLSGVEEDDDGESNPWVALPGCQHWFHSACIYAWLDNHKTCPLCREPHELARYM